MTDTELALILNVVVLPVTIRALLESAALRGRPRSSQLMIALLLWCDLAMVLWLDCSMFGFVWFAVALALTILGWPVSLRDYTRILGGARLPLYLASVATLAFTAYVHLPITTFLTSPGELDIHLEHLVKTNIRDAMVTVLVAAIIYGLASPPRLRTAMTLFALGAVAIALLYSYVLPFGYPLMSGLMFEQIPVPVGTLVSRAVVDAAAIGAVVLLVPSVLRRAGPRRTGVVLALANLSLLGASALSIYSPRSEEARNEASSIGVEPPLVFSQGGPNVLIVFLDRFMGGYVESLLEHDSTLKTRLSGFTWYPRTVSAGENSIAGVHPVFGGYDYVPRAMNARGESLKKVSAEAYNILPGNFSRAGYDVHFVNPRGLGFTMEGDCGYLQGPNIHCTHVPVSIARDRAAEMGVPTSTLSQSNYGDLLVLLGTMRAAPYSFKAVLNQRGPWRPFMDHSAGTTFRQWAELEALPRLTQVTGTGEHFNVYWSILPHEPYFMGDDCLPRSTPLDLTREEVARRGQTSLFAVQHAIAARCSLQMVATYFDWMKQVGVYEQTRIIVVSDHGIVGPVEDRSSRAVAGGTTDNLFVRTRSLLLVKPRGSSAPLQVSEEFLPNAEVPRIACEEIGTCTNPYLNDRPIRSEAHDKPFVVSMVPWQFNLQKHDAFVILRELQLTGSDPYDVKNWTELERRE